MKIKQALNRVFWRFGGNNNKHPFPVNQDDVDSYNAIEDYITKKEKEQFTNQELFAKLYIYLYMKILENEKTTIMDLHARKKIYNLLKKPMAQVIQDFTQSLNDSEAYSLLDSLGVDSSDSRKETEQINKLVKEKLKEAVKTSENVSKLLGEVWDYDFVADCLESEVNQAINLFE